MHLMAEAASFSSPSSSTIAFSFTDHFTGNTVTLSQIPLSPAEQRAQIERPLELVQAAAWFFARQSPVGTRHQQQPQAFFGYMRAEYSPVTPVRAMLGFVAATCQRLATAPGTMNVTAKAIRRWAGFAMDRVLRGHVGKVEVQLMPWCAWRLLAAAHCEFLWHRLHV
jgi:hypothetical protein